MALATPQADQTALEPVADSRRPAAPSIALWCAIGLLAAAGCLGIERELALLWRCWTTDPLRSIGMLIPPASIILTLRVWRQNGWQLRGSWWGLALIGAAFFVSILHQSAELFFTAGNALVSLIPLTLPVYLYGSGIVLLFAGARVWRKAWFPLGLLAALAARACAHQQHDRYPSAEHLRPRRARVRNAHPLRSHHSAASPHVLAGFWHVHRARLRRHSRRSHSGISGSYPRLSQARYAASLGGVRYRWRPAWLPLQLHPPMRSRRLLPHRTRPSRAGGRCQAGRLRHRKLPVPAGDPDLYSPCEPESGTGLCRSRANPAKSPGPAPIVPGARNQRRQRAINSSAAPHLPSSCSPFLLCLHPRCDRGKARRPQPCRRLHPSPASQNKSAASRSRAPGTSSQADKRSSKAEPTPRLDQTRSSSPSGLRRSSTTTTPIRAGWRAASSPSASLPCPSSQRKANSLDLSTGFYNDGVTDSIVVSVACTPGSCSQSQQVASKGHFSFFVLKPQVSELAGGAAHPVPIMIRIDRPQPDRPQSDAPQSDQPHSSDPAATQTALTAEAQRFLSGLDPMSLSQAFQ